MTLEVLANELLLELFEFFDAAELLRAFYGLNRRFNTLLLTQFRAYHVNFYSILKYQSDFLARQHLPLIFNEIISLRLSDNYDDNIPQIDFSFSSGLQINQFINLRSLSLSYINDKNIFREIIGNCIKLSHLTHLKVVKCHTEYIGSHHFSNIIWGLTTLTHCRLDIEDDFRIPTLVSLSIEYLSISCRCWQFSQTLGLFQQTPHLRRLHLPCNNLNDTSEILIPYFSSITILKLSNVRSLEIMKGILLAVPSLIELKIDAHKIDCDGYQWEQIIDEHLPKLKIFHLKMYVMFSDEKNNKQNVDNFVDSFHTRFWLEKHQWYIRYHCRSPIGFRLIFLYSVPYAFNDFDTIMLTVPYESTCLQAQDTDNHLYDKVNHLHCNPWSYTDQSLIRFFNLRELSVRLPLNKNFAETIATFHQLKSLIVSSTSEDAQFLLQSLLDQTPNLYSLTIRSWPVSQIPLLGNTNTSVRRLDLRMNQEERASLFFTVNECNTLIQSLLVMQCEELLIKVQDCQSIIDLSNNMCNLQLLYFQCEISLTSYLLFEARHLNHTSSASQFVFDPDHSESFRNMSVNWLKDQLPTANIISKFSRFRNEWKLWMYWKKL